LRCSIINTMRGVTWTSGLGDASQGLYARARCAAWWTKKMLDMKDLRIVWKSRPIQNGPADGAQIDAGCVPPRTCWRSTWRCRRRIRTFITRWTWEKKAKGWGAGCSRRTTRRFIEHAEAGSRGTPIGGRPADARGFPLSLPSPPTRGRGVLLLPSPALRERARGEGRERGQLLVLLAAR